MKRFLQIYVSIFALSAAILLLGYVLATEILHAASAEIMSVSAAASTVIGIWLPIRNMPTKKQKILGVFLMPVNYIIPAAMIYLAVTLQQSPAIIHGGL